MIIHFAINNDLLSCASINTSNTKNQIKLRQFTYKDLESGTLDFSSAYLLGKGSHGSVYKAVLDDGNLIAAVKRSCLPMVHEANNNSNCLCQGDNEIEILSAIRTPTIVNLLGYSFDYVTNKSVTVVEFMLNGSLYNHLHSSLQPPDWKNRFKFALQIAKAVESLHLVEPAIIHRDIKSSNVLIDKNWNARLGDFGLAVRGHTDEIRLRNLPPAGTLGYIDPAYVTPEDLNVKNDVFSFGILLLEIVSGRKAIDTKYSQSSILDWALPIITKGELLLLCDPRIRPPEDPLAVQELVMLAVRCTKMTAEKRPSMTEVVKYMRVMRKRVFPSVWINILRWMRRTKVVKPLSKQESAELVFK